MARKTLLPNLSLLSRAFILQRITPGLICRCLNHKLYNMNNIYLFMMNFWASRKREILSGVSPLNLVVGLKKINYMYDC